VHEDRRAVLDRILLGTDFIVGSEDGQAMNILTRDDQPRNIVELVRRLEAAGLSVRLSGDSRLIVA